MPVSGPIPPPKLHLLSSSALFPARPTSHLLSVALPQILRMSRAKYPTYDSGRAARLHDLLAVPDHQAVVRGRRRVEHAILGNLAGLLVRALP